MELCATTQALNDYLDICDDFEKNRDIRISYLREARSEFRRTLLDGTNKQAKTSEIIEFIGEISSKAIGLYIETECEDDFDIFFAEFRSGKHQQFYQTISSAIARMLDHYVGEME